jgi:transmembrane sensor
LEPVRKKLLLNKFFNDESTNDELEELMALVRNSKVYDSDFDGLMEKIMAKQNHSLVLNYSDSENIFQRVVRGNEEDNVSRKLLFIGYAFKVAAVFIGALVIAFIAYKIYVAHTFNTVYTAYGQTKDLILPDGSKVTLNANSNISYKKNWNKGEDREVELTGEAFFEVTHKKNNQKFTVRTRDLNVEVLGTKFNVLSRKSRSMVLLNSGKVKLDIRSHEGFIMKPGEMVEINTEESTVKKSLVRNEKYTSWKKKILTFESTTIADIARLIDDNYGIKIVIKNKKLANEKFTGTFPVDEDINLLLKMLSKANKFKMVEKDGYIIFQ